MMMLHPDYQWLLKPLALFSLTLFLCFIGFKVLSPYISKRLRHFTNKWTSALGRSKITNTLPHIMISVLGLSFFKSVNCPGSLGTIIHSVFVAYFSLSVTYLIHKLIVFLENIITSNDHVTMPAIRAYSQFSSLVVIIIGLVITVCLILNVSPAMFLGSLGAIAAFLTLIFKDTLQSFISCLQIAFNRLVLKGDFVRIDSHNLEGEVIDISLNFIKIKAKDETIFVLPTYKLLETSFENRRNLSVEKARRIKKAFFLDQDSVTFLTPEMKKRYEKNPLVQDILKDLEKCKTNSSLFRAFIEHSLSKNPLIREDKPIIVRLLDPTPEGLPLEVYAFTKEYDWLKHEKIKTDILEVALVSLKEFGLKVHQIH